MRFNTFITNPKSTLVSQSLLNLLLRNYIFYNATNYYVTQNQKLSIVQWLKTTFEINLKKLTISVTVRIN